MVASILISLRQISAPRVWAARELVRHAILITPSEEFKKIKTDWIVDTQFVVALIRTQVENETRANDWFVLMRQCFEKTKSWNLFEERMIRDEYIADFRVMRDRFAHGFREYESEEIIDQIEDLTDTDMRAQASILFGANSIREIIFS